MHELLRRAGMIAVEGLVGLALLAPAGYALAWGRQRINAGVVALQVMAAAQVKIASALEKLAARR